MSVVCRLPSRRWGARKPPAIGSPPRPNDVDVPIGEKAAGKRRSWPPKELGQIRATRPTQPQLLLRQCGARSILASTWFHLQERPGGDLLICEIDHSDRWLLFPPMDLRCVSARKGEWNRVRSEQRDPLSPNFFFVNAERDQFLPVLGFISKYWQELISLRIDEEEVGAEWVSLLGSDPIPPSMGTSTSFGLGGEPMAGGFRALFCFARLIKLWLRQIDGVVMLRSAPGDETKYWQELISLRIDEEEVGAEWVSLIHRREKKPAIRMINFTNQKITSRPLARGVVSV
jgi:hypothetical protein